MRILIAHTSLSGNTRDLARRVRACCEARGHAVTWVDADIETLAAATTNPVHDLYLLGAWTANAGRTPAEMKRLIAELVALVGKPACLAVFGTGETQWGAEYYCGALRRMATFFGTRHPRLEIEQMPHGARDADKIERWVDAVLDGTEQELHQVACSPIQPFLPRNPTSTPHADPQRNHCR